MHRESILETLDELDRWRRRREALLEELDNVERQLAYYEALAAEMKREVRPARVSDLFAAISR